MLKAVSVCIVFFLISVVTISTADARSRKPDVVKDIDLDQYSGTWYEIARLPNKHEKDMVEVTSTFTRTKDGGYVIINRGYKGSRGGKCSTVKGDVSIPDKKTKGAMKVKVWFLNIDYRVLDVDKEKYQYALVSSDSQKYLWIMSKQPVMDPVQFENLVDMARDKGYNVDDLEKVSQVHNSAVAQR